MTTTVTATSTATATATDTYVEDCHIIFQETFEESPGYDNEGWMDGAFSPNPDFVVPVGIVGWGSECFGPNVVDNKGIAHIYIDSTSTIYFKFEFYAPTDNNDADIEVFNDNDTYTFLLAFADGTLDLYGYDGNVILDTCTYGKETQYKLEIYYELGTGNWEWRLNDINQGSGIDLDSILCNSDHLYVGVGSSGPKDIYVDNIDIRTEPPAGW